MKLYDNPPLISTWKKPEDIIGAGNMAIFADIIEAHRKAALSGGSPTARDLREIDKSALQAFPAVLEELRANGFYPNGVDEKGRPMFQQARASQIMEIFNAGLSEYEGLTPEQCQQMARNGWHKIIANNNGESR